MALRLPVRAAPAEHRHPWRAVSPRGLADHAWFGFICQVPTAESGEEAPGHERDRAQCVPK